MTNISITRTKQEIAVIRIRNAWKEEVVMGAELELLLISANMFLNRTDQHTHPPNTELTAVRKKRTMLILPPATLFQQTLQGGTEAVLAKIPKLETARRDFRRQKAIANGYSPIPPKNAI